MNVRANIPTTLENSAFFMPFSMNRQFKKAPRLLARAEGMYYYTPEGRKILDGTAGLWCVNAGHCRKKIVDAVAKGVATLDFAPPFQMGHPLAFEFAERGGLQLIDVAHVPEHLLLDQLGGHRFPESFDVHRAA